MTSLSIARHRQLLCSKTPWNARILSLAMYLTLVATIPLIAIDKDLTLAPRSRWRSFITAILISLPVRQHGADPRTICQFVNLLKVLLADLKRLSRYIGNVFPH